jgi:K+:H+ antiporter
MELTGPGVLELGAVLLLAALAGHVARRLGLPAVIGYLVVGIAVSPFTPGYVADRGQLAFVADIGVVLLLFEVGIEIDVVRIWRDHGPIAWLAPVQVVVTSAISVVALTAFGVPLLGAGFIGLGIAMSSSVVVVNITRSGRRTTSQATERALLGWSVVQDVFGIALSALLLAAADASRRPPAVAALGAVVFVLAITATAWILPRVVRRLAGEDLILIVSVGVGLALAGFGGAVAQIPLALAAFAAGLVVADGPEAAEIRRRLSPFRDVFAVLFFVVLGSLIDPAALGRGLGWLALVLGLLVLGKSVVIGGLVRAARVTADWRQMATGLGQVGEFSFVLASAAATFGLVSGDLYAAVLGSVVVSIAASTLLVRRIDGRRTAVPAT